MALEHIEASPEDVNFRKAVKSAIDSAKREIIVVAGELGSYGFPELREAAKEALERNVRIKVYATSAAPGDVVDDIRNLGGEIYIGEIRVKDHYLMVDGITLVVSEKERAGKPTDIGTRRARVYKDSRKANEVAQFFNDLVRSDFTSKVARKSMISSVASIVSGSFIPSYRKPVKEPRIVD